MCATALNHKPFFGQALTRKRGSNTDHHLPMSLTLGSFFPALRPHTSHSHTYSIETNCRASFGYEFVAG